MQTITANVEIEFPDGKKSIEMELKNKEELENCEKGTVVILNCRSGEQITGFFRHHYDDEDITIDPLNGGKWSLDVKYSSVKDYWEELK